MSTLIVQRGIYRFFSRGELDAERLRYKEQVKAAGSNLVSSSVNGQTFTFSVQGREMSLEEWGDVLADAYNQLGIVDYGIPTPNRVRTRF